MSKDTSIASTLADFLDRDVAEVKGIVMTMGLKDLMDVISGIQKNDKEKVFRIYSGYSV